MTRMVQLSSGSQARRAGAYDRDFLAAAGGGRIGNDPALIKSLINNCTFDIFNSDRRLVHPQHTSTLAGCGAYPTGELREVIGLMQALQCLLPAALIHHVIPFGDQIVNRATFIGLTEWHTTVHAPGSLCGQVPIIVFGVNFLEIYQPFHGITIGLGFPIEFLKPCELSH